MIDKIFDDVTKFAENSANKIGEIAVDVGKAAGDLGNEAKKKVEETAGQALDIASSIPDNIKESLKNDDVKAVALSEQPQNKYSVWNSAKILYYLMLIDGEVSDSEWEKMDLILKNLDPENIVDRDQMVKECTDSVAEDYGTDRRVLSIQDKVEKLLEEPDSDDNTINSRQLLFNMLSLAYGDDDYTKNEKTLIQYYAIKANIPIDIALEIEDTLIAIMDAEKEIDNISHQKRYYLEIAPIIESLNKRVNILSNNVIDLTCM